MDIENRQDIKIVGDDSSAGGIFNNVTIVGNVTMNSSVDCIRIKAVGDCIVNDELKMESGSITGNLTVKNSLIADRLKIAGNLTTGINASIKHSSLYGDINIDGNFVGEKISARGFLTVKANCNADTFKSKCVFKINGLLNADEIDMELYGNSSIREIGGEKITIKKGSKSIFHKLFGTFMMPNNLYNGNLTTDLIEGDELYLESTKAKIVRGKNVIIGPGCDIDLLEYSEKFNQLNDAVVKEKRKIE